jgi:hypothetical protein
VPVRSQLTAVGAESSKLAGATSMIATDISGAKPFGAGARPESSVIAEVEPGTVHLAVPYTSRWHVAVNGKDIPPRPAFGLTNAYDIPEKSTVELSFASSGIHSGLILIQFAAWCTVLYIALSRRRRFVRRRESQSFASVEPVMVIDEGIQR